MDPVIHASCGNAFVYKSDLELLQPGNWLNDNLISFYMACILTDSTINLNKYSTLESCVVSFIVNQLDPDEPDFSDECRNMSDAFGESTRFVIPVNSTYALASNFGEVGAGVHWSLLSIEFSEDEGQGEKARRRNGRDGIAAFLGLKHDLRFLLLSTNASSGPWLRVAC